jgi:ribose transport system permease protein
MSTSSSARQRFDVRAVVRSLTAGSGAVRVYGVLLLLFVVSWILVTLYGAPFLTVDNLTNIVLRSVALGLVAAGQTLVILAGSLDLSVAYLISVVAVMTSFIMQGNPDNILPALAFVLLIGLAVGLANGLVITKFGVNAFIATLGMGLILRGVLFSAFDNFAGSVPRAFQELAYGSFGPVPYPIILLAVVFLAVWFLLRSTRFGHHLYAVGGGEETTRLSGIRSHRVIITAHVMCSLSAVLTGLFLVSRTSAGQPRVGIDGAYDLESIAAVVVGGTALAGGRGGVMGTLAGVLILAVLDNVFNALQINAFVKDILRGAIIVTAVAVYAYQARRGHR